MENANKFREKIHRGEVSLGTTITFVDSTVTEALCSLLDFVWIDMEHNALSLETVQAHLMATKGSNTTSLVRVPWNDPVLIKPVLDIGADRVIVPLVRTADDVRRAVAACRQPPVDGAALASRRRAQARRHRLRRRGASGDGRGAGRLRPDGHANAQVSRHADGL